jgi:hypothetical protein
VPTQRFFAHSLLFLLLTGCNVAERTRQCEALAKTLKQASPGLAEPRIEKNPKPELLRNKAARYSSLAGHLERLAFSDAKLKSEVTTLRTLLTQVENHLEEAALSVERTQKDQKPAPPAPSSPGAAPSSPGAAPIPPNARDRLAAQRASFLRGQLRRYEFLRKAIDTSSIGINASLSRLTIECR